MAKKQLTRKEREERNKVQRDRRAKKKKERETNGGNAPAKEKKVRRKRNGKKSRTSLGSIKQLNKDADLLRAVADKLDSFAEAFSALAKR